MSIMLEEIRKRIANEKLPGRTVTFREGTLEIKAKVSEARIVKKELLIHVTEPCRVVLQEDGYKDKPCDIPFKGFTVDLGRAEITNYKNGLLRIALPGSFYALIQPRVE